MKAPNSRTATEQEKLSGLATRVENFCDEITVPRSPADLPDLLTASQELVEVNDLVAELADHVVAQSARAHSPEYDPGPVIRGYASAAGYAGQAVAHFTQAYSRLGALHWPAGALSDQEDAVFETVLNHLGLAQESLDAVVVELRNTAEALDGPPSTGVDEVVALSRSPRLLDAVARVSGPVRTAVNLIAPQQGPGRGR
ncbi:hypothetical protein [Streptomyces tsukubensis]|uniref:hypothetical protein n=1 Tax=Streptomyces tsukubensis TaxID=83656 RepID=UPI00344FE82B